MTKVLVFDTETTGLPKFIYVNGHKKRIMPYIVQMSWILYDVVKNKVLSAHDHIVRLPNGIEIPEESIQFHKITQEMMDAHGERVNDVLMDFVDDVKLANYIVAHNLSFDKEMVECEFSRNGMINRFDVMKASLVYYCTMKESTELCNIQVPDTVLGGMRIKYPRLEELHTYLFKNCELSNLHNSFNDVLVCLRCFYKMLYDRDVVRVNRELRKQFKDVFGIIQKPY